MIVPLIDFLFISLVDCISNSGMKSWIKKRVVLFQMEAGQIEVDGSFGAMNGTPYTLAAPLPLSVQENHLDSRTSSTKMKKFKGANQEPQEKDTTPSNAVHKFYIIILVVN